MKYIKDMGEWNALMETSKTKLVVVDFTASWWYVLDGYKFIRRYMLYSTYIYIYIYGRMMNSEGVV